MGAQKKAVLTGAAASFRPWSDAEIQKIRELRADGMFFRDIAVIVKRSTKSLEALATRLELPDPKARRNASIIAMIHGGSNSTEIAAAIGIDRATVRAVALANDLVIRNAFVRVKKARANRTPMPASESIRLAIAARSEKHRKHREEMAPEVSRMAAMGLGRRTVAKVLNSNDRTIARISVEHGIEWQQQNHAPKHVLGPPPRSLGANSPWLDAARELQRRGMTAYRADLDKLNRPEDFRREPAAYVVSGMGIVPTREVFRMAAAR